MRLLVSLLLVWRVREWLDILRVFFCAFFSFFVCSAPVSEFVTLFGCSSEWLDIFKSIFLRLSSSFCSAPVSEFVTCLACLRVAGFFKSIFLAFLFFVL